MRVGLVVVVKALVGVVVGSSGGWLEAHGLRPAGLRTSIGKARAEPCDNSRWLPSWFPPRVLVVVAGSASFDMLRDLLVWSGNRYWSRPYTVVALARDLRTYHNADHPSYVAFRLCASIGRASTERQYPSARVTRPLLTYLMLSSPHPYQRTESSRRVVAGASL